MCYSLFEQRYPLLLWCSSLGLWRCAAAVFASLFDEDQPALTPVRRLIVSRPWETLPSLSGGLRLHTPVHCVSRGQDGAAKCKLLARSLWSFQEWRFFDFACVISLFPQHLSMCVFLICSGLISLRCITDATITALNSSPDLLLPSGFVTHVHWLPEDFQD